MANALASGPSNGIWKNPYAVSGARPIVIAYCTRALEAIARPIGTRNSDPLVAQLEDELFSLLNETGIGPMGLGGDVTVLQCHIEHADTHMTLNPVAVNYQCWAARRASAHIAADGSVDYDREA